jgi:hypothetical protein
MRRASFSRSGYTLLEVILTLGIAVLLLAGLYIALNTLLSQQRVGRSLAAHNAVLRSLLARLEHDLTSELAPLDPRVNPLAVQLSSGVVVPGASGGSTRNSSSGGSASSGTTGTGGPTSTSNASNNTAGSSTGNASGVSQMSGTGVGTEGPVVFNLGLQGDATHLTLYTSLAPTEVLRSLTAPSQTTPLVSDLRRITYWLAGSPDAPLGLARQEIKIATSADALTPFDPSQVDEKACVLAEEVVGLSFQYFDGSDWLDSWDGTQVQADGQTPLGPPLAVAINLTLRRNTENGEDNTVNYRYVIALPTANNFLTTPSGNSAWGSTGSTTGNASSGTAAGSSAATGSSAGTPPATNKSGSMRSTP